MTRGHLLGTASKILGKTQKLPDSTDEMITLNTIHSVSTDF